MLSRVALLFAAALASTSDAQVRDNVTVEVVQVPVYVTTSGGQPVRGLTRDSFTLLVDRHPQTVDYFDVSNAISRWSERACLAWSRAKAR